MKFISSNFEICISSMRFRHFMCRNDRSSKIIQSFHRRAVNITYFVLVQGSRIFFSGMATMGEEGGGMGFALVAKPLKKELFLRLPLRIWKTLKRQKASHFKVTGSTCILTPLQYFCIICCETATIRNSNRSGIRTIKINKQGTKIRILILNPDFPDAPCARSPYYQLF